MLLIITAIVLATNPVCELDNKNLTRRKNSTSPDQV